MIVIPFPKPDGNGAREALIEIVRSPAARCLGEWDAPAVTDYLLAKLFVAGFAIVPVDSINPLDHEQTK